MEILTHTATHLNLENNMLSKKSQSPTDKHTRSSLTLNSTPTAQVAIPSTRRSPRRSQIQRQKVEQGLSGDAGRGE